MIVTVFRSRLNPETSGDYLHWAARMGGWAQTIPGYVSHKSFVAEDGERVTVVEFEHEQGMRAWASHPEHVEAKKLGRKSFFTEYKVQVCSVDRVSQFQGGAS